MSISSEDGYSNEDIAAILDMAREPSYISEIARKLEEYYDDWGMTGSGSIEKVAIAASMFDGREDVDLYSIGYSGESMGQVESSPMNTIADGEDGQDNRWNTYTLIHYKSDGEVRDAFKDAVDPSVTPEDKRSIIQNLSGTGNEISKDAEKIMQDVMQRQFKYYEVTEAPDYNDPGVDFYVEDEGNREWGLAIEVSVRWVNPIDSPYLNSKEEKAMERDADLVILAPRFTNSLMEQYEDPDNTRYNADPLSEMVHLHRVPSGSPEVYRPFAKKQDEVGEGYRGGNPVIVQDEPKAMEMLESRGNVGDDYPVVSDSRGRFLASLDVVNREGSSITESEYRNQLREAIEPLLWEFLRPYKIEQFLVDTYWDKGLNQGGIGRLIDRSGSTVGDWMRKWGVMRRGTGAPELSDRVVEIWKRMYNGEDPFPQQFSGYRILAEYNRHPMWTLDDWEDWYQNTTEEERKETVVKQGSYRDNLGYTLMFNPSDRLQPSYSFVLKTLKDNGVDVRNPDEAPRVPYSAYPSKGSVEFMLNKNQNTIVDVTEEDGE